jgi:signal transduction histidine kinase/CheY-like chemotaxis protein
MPEETMPNAALHRLAEASALAGIGVWTWDPASQRLHADAALAAQLRRAGREAGEIEDLFPWVHPDDRADLQAALRTAFARASSDTATTDPVGIEVECRILVGNGGATWLALRGGAVRDADGSPGSLCGVCFDVSVRKLAERSLLQTKQALEVANRAKDGFLARVSHEVRTPLTAILGYAELLAARLSTPQDRRDIAEIRDNGKYLQRLVDDLLDLSRIIAGRIPVERRAVDLRRLSRELESSMHMRAEQKGLAFTFEVETEVPSHSLSDPVRIRQILSNLIGNALKFTQAGAVSVRVRRDWRNGRPCVAFEVHDTGPGIEAARLRRLFEPFSQEENAEDAPQHDGLGLGLAISQRLADILGGTIEVDSQAGRGSVFTLLLPLTEVAGGAQAADAADDAGDRPAAARTRLQGRVLVVDDVDAVVNLLRSHLEGAGLAVTGTADGHAALEALAAAQRAGEPFDLMLLDLHMPQLGGRETLERLRAAGHGLPVIALTASTMKGERERCLAWGFDAFLSKPFTGEQLLRGVSAALAGRPRRAPAAAAAQRPADGRAILLVEDHVSLAELTAEQLGSLGHRVELAHSGAAAIDRAVAIRPDAMIIDLNLPDMDGIELCRALRREPALAGCRLIAYTGDEEAQAHARARAAGFDAVLLKPAAPQAFDALLRAAS